jgi:putative glycerol-1-phosphate prenyltransferase
VSSAPLLKASGMEIISTAYLLVDGGKMSSVEYISNTKPIPHDKSDLAASTAIAGEMLGMKLLYLEAGSGAVNPVPEEMIKKVKENINIPLIVGGGLNTERKVKEALDAGADMIVVGNAFEKNPQKLKDYLHIVRNSR